MSVAKDWSKIGATVIALVVAIYQKDPAAIGAAVLALVNLFLHPPTAVGLGLPGR